MTDTPWWEQTLQIVWPPERPRKIKPEWWRVCLDSQGRCEYCGFDAASDARLLLLLEGDHIVPESEGGSEDPLNYAMACRICNELKGEYDPSEGKGSAKTQEERKLLTEKTESEITRLLSQRSQEEFPFYLRVWQLTLNEAKKSQGIDPK